MSVQLFPQAGSFEPVEDQLEPEPELLAGDRGRKVAPVVDRTYDLPEVPAAFRYLLKGRVQGKLVLTM